MQPSTFKALQITKISKLSLLSLPPLFFNRRERQEKRQNRKANLSLLRENNLRPLNWYLALVNH